jgi:hypothetical protein
MKLKIWANPYGAGWGEMKEKNGECLGLLLAQNHFAKRQQIHARATHD